MASVSAMSRVSTRRFRYNVLSNIATTQRLRNATGLSSVLFNSSLAGPNAVLRKPVCGLTKNISVRQLSSTSRPFRVNTNKTTNDLQSPNQPSLRENNSGELQVEIGSQAIPNVWLRDNCQCATCVHTDTKQRLLDTFSIPENISISSGSVTDNQIIIEWSDSHKSQYNKTLLSDAAQPLEKRNAVRQGLIDISLWDSSIAASPPEVSYNSPTTTDIPAILTQIRKYGFCYVTSVPATPEATEALLRRISFIRETHYGGFYDFTSDLASKDTAYTNIALEAHTDTTYFSEPAGLQAFHLLEHSGGEGGASLLVDGFKVAEELMRTDPEAYEILATTNVHSHASGNEGISIQPYRGFPVFEHDNLTGDLLRVRWNSSDRAAVELPVFEVGKWYDAARKWDRLLKKRDNEYWEQLKPGSVLIFDNWRVMHGRSAFTGKRRICGGYINRDDWISKFKMEYFGKGEVLGKLASG